MSSATGSIGLSNTGNILYLSNNITTLSSNLTIGTSPVANEQFYLKGNANITGNLIGFSNVLIPNGNLGIGTRNPLYRLDVAGAANISGNLNFSGNLLQNGSPYIGSQWITSAANIYYNTGNVGIRTSTPKFELDVGGNINLTGNIYINTSSLTHIISDTLPLIFIDSVTPLNLITSASVSQIPNFDKGNGTIIFTRSLSQYLRYEPVVSGISINPSNGFTVITKARFTGTTGSFENLFSISGSIGTFFRITRSGTSSSLRTDIQQTGGPGIVGLIGGTVAQDANIVVALRYNPNGNTYSMWNNGSEIANISSSAMLSFTTSNITCGIPGNPGGGDAYLNGNIYGFMYMNRFMSNDELAQANVAMNNSNNLVRVGTMSGRDALFINSLGNIGINNRNPLYEFDLIGTANVYGNLLTYGPTRLGSNANIIGNLGISGNIIGTSNLILLNGNMGIGTVNPLYRLDVAGSANISGNLFVGGATASETTRVIIKNDIVDTVTNGTTSGTSINMLGLNNSSRTWYFGSDGATSGNTQLYLGTSGGQANDPDYFCYWDTSGRMMVYTPVSGSITAPNSTDLFTVRGNANIVGNINFTGNLFQNGNLFTGGGGSQWITGNGSGNIYYNGNVGINKSNPIYALDVAGDANIGANVYGNNFYIRNDCILQSGDFSILNGNLTVYEKFNAFGESVLTGNLTVYNSDIYNYGNIYTYNGLYINKNGALYNLNENPNQHAFYAYDTVNLMTTLFAGADDTNAVGYIGVGGYGGSLPLILNPLGGNVGINNGNPMERLDIKGSANISVNAFVRNNLAVGTTTATANLTIVGNTIITGNLNVDNGLLWTDPINNRVGINNTNPQYTLDVNGDANVNGNLYFNSDGDGIDFYGTGNKLYKKVGAGIVCESGSFRVANVTGAITVLHIETSTGNLGLGTTTPNTQLQLSTDGARKLTTTTWATGSDYRIKEDIVDANIDRCYDIISNIKLKHYKWIPEIAEKNDDKSMLGWIAQDVEEYFPKAVSKSNEYGLSDFRSLNADQIYKVMYGALQKVIQKVEIQDLIIQNLQSEISIIKSNI